MSAWVCSGKHINLIASFAAAHGIKVEWRHEAFDSPLDAPHVIDCAKEQQRVAQVLLDENYRSVNYRYDENNHEAITFEHVTVSNLGYGFIYKQLACYDYQACETDDYESTLAHAIVKACEAKLFELTGMNADQLEKTESYAGAPWGVD